jgi:hypothetical protein
MSKHVIPRDERVILDEAEISQLAVRVSEIRVKEFETALLAPSGMFENAGWITTNGVEPFSMPSKL